MSSFYEQTSEDERKDWRKHPVTEMAIAMLKEHARDVASEALKAIRANEDGAAKLKAGEADGVQFCIDLLENE